MKKLFYYLLFTIIFLNTNLSKSQEHNIFRMDMVEVNYITSISRVNDNKDFYVGLKFNLMPEWKIYWRQPGDSGMPPEIDYSKSININKFEIKWPYPVKEYESADLLTNVYKNEVILPIKISIREVGKPLKLNTKINFQVCKDICIPLESNLFLNINSGISKFTDDLYLIEKALSKVPMAYEKAGIKNIKVSQNTSKSLLLNIESTIQLSNDDLVVFLESATEYIKISDIKIKFKDNYNIVAELFLEKKLVDLQTVQMTIVQGDLVAYSSSIRIESSISKNLLIILFMAFIGGFILNFMPCVLPVLTLKITRILGYDYINNFNVRLNFLLTALGIIFSFICLAFMIIVIRELGGEVGWGIQFQQPIFLFFLIFILTIFSLNLFNFIEINLPSKLSSYINNYIQHKKYGIAFFEGAFATLLATPCSAPFLGPAVSFALSSNTYVILFIFTFLGIGMAFPYLLFIIFPSLVNLLPKPGIWMVYLKYVLASGLILTATWLAFVCSSIVGISLFILVMVCLLLFVLFLVNNKYLRRYRYLLVFLIIGNIYFIYSNKDIGDHSNSINSSDWLQYNNDTFLHYINSGKTIFIDITADWCVTCKVNKLLVLNNKEFKKFIKKNNIILMRGNWTKPSSEITQFLQKSNRYGIPFNALYGINYPRGIIFSEILTLNEIINSYKKMHISYAE